MISRSYILTTVLFLFGLFAYGQTPLDSTYQWAEMEDSMKAISIVYIEKPEELLDSIIEQVIYDYRQKPIACKYLTTHASTKDAPSHYFYQCILHTKANIQIKTTGVAENFHYEGRRKLKNLNDTAKLYHDLKSFVELDDCILREVLIRSDENNVTSLFQTFKNLMQRHHIKVYRISYESGEGVYRIDFSPNTKYKYYVFGRFTGTAYVDKKTLRMKRIAADIVSPTSFDKHGIKSKKLLSHIHHTRYQMAFEDIGGTLVVKHREAAESIDDEKPLWKRTATILSLSNDTDSQAIESLEKQAVLISKGMNKHTSSPKEASTGG